MAKMGPNNASGVVWALGTFVLFFSCFYVLTNKLKFYLCFKCLRRVGVGCDNKTGLNNAFGPLVCSFFLFLRVFLLLIFLGPFLYKCPPPTLEPLPHPFLTRNANRRGVSPLLLPTTSLPTHQQQCRSQPPLNRGFFI